VIPVTLPADGVKFGDGRRSFARPPQPIITERGEVKMERLVRKALPKLFLALVLALPLYVLFIICLWAMLTP
jgi:hypothetical protein